MTSFLRPASVGLAALAVLFLEGTGRAQAVPAIRPDPATQKARAVPNWVRDGVVYEIFTRNFSPEGTFAGVEERLGALQDLGVNILWFMPIHPSGQEKKKGSVGSPYAVRDFRAINPDYGTEADFKRLVRAAHDAGMKVVIDLVANHTSWDNVLIGSNADFYTKDEKGRIIPPNPDWSDVADLNYENPKLRAYMIETLRRWIEEFDLDGFRCDVAGEVPTAFWETARRELEKVKPGVFMLAEANKPELMVEAFDADYAWPFQGALNDVLLNGQPASRIRESWAREQARFPAGAVHLYFTDNHDERRAIARFGEKASLAASALVFGLDGVPLLYNGQEVGDTSESGAPALFEKIPVFWGIAERRPDFPRFYDRMIQLRADHPALRGGSLEWLANSDESRVLTWLRSGGSEEVLVAVNLSSRPLEGLVVIEPRADSPFVDVTPGLGPKASSSATGTTLPRLALEPWGYRFLARPGKER